MTKASVNSTASPCHSSKTNPGMLREPIERHKPVESSIRIRQLCVRDRFITKCRQEIENPLSLRIMIHAPLPFLLLFLNVHTFSCKHAYIYIHNTTSRNTASIPPSHFISCMSPLLRFSAQQHGLHGPPKGLENSISIRLKWY